MRSFLNKSNKSILGKTTEEHTKYSTSTYRTYFAAFAQDVLKMASAPVFTQVMGLLVMPFITRLYSPESFGLLGLYGSITGPIGVFATMSYSTSVMLPRNDKDASNMLGVCLVFTVFVTGLSILLISFGKEIIVGLLKAQKLTPYLWLVPVSIFLGGLYMSLRYWNMRIKRFGHIATGKISRFIFNNGVVLGTGFSGHASASSLICGGIVGEGANTTVLGRRIWKEYGQLFKRSINWRQMLTGMKRYRKFPLYILWTDFLSIFSGQVPIYLLSYYFSQPIIGYYSLGLRLLTMPMNLLGNSIGEVFFQRESQNKGKNTFLLENLFKCLVLFGMLPFLLFGLIGKDLFTFAFGTNWSEAGVYAQILSFFIFIRFITVPASYLILIFEKQEHYLFINISNIAISIFSIAIGGLFENIYLSFLLLSLLNGLLYAGYGFFFINRAGLALSKIFKILWHSFILSLPVLIIVSSAKWYFRLSYLSVIAVSTVGTIIFFSMVLKQDAELRPLILEFLSKVNFIKKK